MFVRNVAPAKSRRRASIWGALSALVLFAAPLSAQTTINLHVFKFWRPPDLTLIESFATIPLSLLSFVGADGNQVDAIVDRRLEIRDNSGLAVLNQVVRDTVRVDGIGATSIARAEISHHYAFQLKPGTYVVRLEVSDVRTGTKWTVEKPTAAYASMPRSSDLVVASDLVAVSADRATPATAIVRGKVAVMPNFAGALTPDKARIALYTEVYRMDMPPESAQVQIVVRGVGSEFLYRTPAQPRIYPGGIGSEAFALDLTGLPPGSYQLQMRIGSARDTISSTHPISMLPPGSGVVQAPMARLFTELNEAQLDTLFGPLRYMTTQAEAESYTNLSGADAKRRWLTEFWQRNAAAAGEPVEEMLREWEERLRFVNRDFQPARKGQGNRAGWQTDRGRIYMKFGPPEERNTSGQNRTGEVKACEVWQYTSGRGDRYIFFDRTGFGDFELVFSTDRNEPGRPEYETVLQNFRTCDS